MSDSWVGKQLTIHRGRRTVGYRPVPRSGETMQPPHERRDEIPAEAPPPRICFGRPPRKETRTEKPSGPRTSITWPDPCDSWYPYNLRGDEEVECEEPEIPPVQWKELSRKVRRIRVEDPNDPEVYLEADQITQLVEQRQDTGEIHIHDYNPEGPQEVEGEDA